MDLETSEIILKGLKRSSWAESRRHMRQGSLVKIHMIFTFQKVSWASSLTLSRDTLVFTFTEQQATLKSLLSMSNNDLDGCTPLHFQEGRLMRRSRLLTTFFEPRSRILPAWPDEIRNEVDKSDSQPARLCSEMIFHSLT